MLRIFETLWAQKTIRDWLVAALSLAGFVLAGALFFNQFKEERFHLTLTAGTPVEMRYRLAQVLVQYALKQGIEIELKPTSGSEESFQQVNAGLLDLALAQGGLGHEGHENAQQVTALYLEPVHLLVKGEIFLDVVKNLAKLKGKVINVNKAGSGTHYLALETLRFAGLSPGDEAGQGDFIAATLGQEELEAETSYKKLPDAIFLVTTMPSRVAKYLVTRHGYRLVGLPFAEAFSLDAYAPDGHPGRRMTLGPDINKTQVYDAVIPAFTYQVEPGVPPAPIHTLGTRLLLVANKNVNARATEKLLDVIFTSSFSHLARPPLNDTLLQLPPELPMHEGAVNYLRRNKPLITGDVIDFLEKVVTIGAAFAGGILFLRQWLRQRNRRRRDEGFEHYIFKVTEIEQRALVLEMGAELELRELLQLQQELGRLKSEALARFVSGAIEGEELMSSFLTHVNDARNYLARLVLHGRDNLEEEAQLQGRPLRELWNEALSGLKAPRVGEATPNSDPPGGPAGPGDHQNFQDPVPST